MDEKRIRTIKGAVEMFEGGRGNLLMLAYAVRDLCDALLAPSPAPQEAPEKAEGIVSENQVRDAIALIRNDRVCHMQRSAGAAYDWAIQHIIDATGVTDRTPSQPTTPPATPATPPWPVAGSKLMIGEVEYECRCESFRADMQALWARVGRDPEGGESGSWLTDDQARTIRETNRKAALCDRLEAVEDELVTFARHNICEARTAIRGIRQAFEVAREASSDL